jgi:hypothetical protein
MPRPDVLIPLSPPNPSLHGLGPYSPEGCSPTQQPRTLVASWAVPCADFVPRQTGAAGYGAYPRWEGPVFCGVHGVLALASVFSSYDSYGLL